MIFSVGNYNSTLLQFDNLPDNLNEFQVDFDLMKNEKYIYSKKHLEVRKLILLKYFSYI